MRSSLRAFEFVRSSLRAFEFACVRVRAFESACVRVRAFEFACVRVRVRSSLHAFEVAGETFVTNKHHLAVHVSMQSSRREHLLFAMKI